MDRATRIVAAIELALLLAPSACSFRTACALRATSRALRDLALDLARRRRWVLLTDPRLPAELGGGGGRVVTRLDGAEGTADLFVDRGESCRYAISPRGAYLVATSVGSNSMRAWAWSAGDPTPVPLSIPFRPKDGSYTTVKARVDDDGNIAIGCQEFFASLSELFVGRISDDARGPAPVALARVAGFKAVEWLDKWYDGGIFIPADAPNSGIRGAFVRDGRAWIVRSSERGPRDRNAQSTFAASPSGEYLLEFRVSEQMRPFDFNIYRVNRSSREYRACGAAADGGVKFLSLQTYGKLSLPNTVRTSVSDDGNWEVVVGIGFAVVGVAPSLAPTPIVIGAPRAGDRGRGDEDNMRLTGRVAANGDDEHLEIKFTADYREPEGQLYGVRCGAGAGDPWTYTASDRRESIGSYGDLRAVLRWMGDVDGPARGGPAIEPVRPSAPEDTRWVARGACVGVWWDPGADREREMPRFVPRVAFFAPRAAPTDFERLSLTEKNAILHALWREVTRANPVATVEAYERVSKDIAARLRSYNVRNIPLNVLLDTINDAERRHIPVLGAMYASAHRPFVERDDGRIASFFFSKDAAGRDRLARWIASIYVKRGVPAPRMAEKLALFVRQRGDPRECGSTVDLMLLHLLEGLRPHDIGNASSELMTLAENMIDACKDADDQHVDAIGTQAVRVLERVAELGVHPLGRFRRDALAAVPLEAFRSSALREFLTSRYPNDPRLMHAPRADEGSSDDDDDEGEVDEDEEEEEEADEEGESADEGESDDSNDGDEERN